MDCKALGLMALGSSVLWCHFGFGALGPGCLKESRANMYRYRLFFCLHGVLCLFQSIEHGPMKCFAELCRINQYNAREFTLNPKP